VLPTLKTLSAAGAKVIVCSHLGRPKPSTAFEVDPKYVLAPVAARMSELLGASTAGDEEPSNVTVAYATDTVGDDARAKVAALTDGGVALLENLRFNKAETSKDDAERKAFAEQLAGLAEAYVDDAFGAVHRKHASVYDVAALLPAYSGGLVAKELDVLGNLTGDPQRPYVVVLGGSKVSDKLAVIQALLPKVDKLLVGGGMCFTFLKAQGLQVGASLLEEEMVPVCANLLKQAGDRIVLPSDIVVADKFDESADTAIVAADAIPDGWLGLDIGPVATATFASEVSAAKTVFWNGPMGVFEKKPFAAGTRGVAEAITKVDGFTVVGGGDSAAAVRALGIDEAGFSHISTGGGASLEYLEGKKLPGVEALEAAK
jgi:phosphoglycerate kinase